ncbi:MAG: hypothetical protein KF714_02635 [Parvibaculum sp.]|jgi:hypothetical protein|nr:hypothetical protein [Parvibaculum sp.]
MDLPGPFDVSEEGPARYSVPVNAVPPGTSRTVPSLSLDYSSRNGNGLVGMGWALTSFLQSGAARRSWIDWESRSMSRRLTVRRESWSGSKTDVSRYRRARNKPKDRVFCLAFRPSAALRQFLPHKNALRG